MNDEFYMDLALKEAKKSLLYDDVPVGAIIVKNDKIISRAHNQKEKNQMVIAHAEILAINKANKKLNTYHLEGTTIYITMEPCLMCMGAILSARIDKIVFGAVDSRFGTKELATNNKFNHKCNIVGGVRQEQCSQLLKDFFKKLR